MMGIKRNFRTTANIRSFFSVTKYLAVVLCTVSASVIAYSQPTSAQTTDDLPTAPPPRKLMSKEEQKQLDGESGVRKRTQIALSMMDSRLKQAEAANADESLTEMFDQLGAFHALMDNSLAFLERSDTNRSKVLNNLKRFEIGIRRFAPRLELLRREAPPSHEYYLRSLLKQLRDARSRAVEPMFSETIVRDNRP